MPQVAVAREVSPVSADTDLPTDPNLRTIADDVLGKLKYSFAVAAAGDHSPAAGQADHVVQAFLATRKPNARAAYQQKAKTLLQAPMAVRSTHFGRFAAIDPQTAATLGSDQIATRAVKLQVDGAALKTSLLNHPKPEPNGTHHDKESAKKAADAAKKVEEEIDQTTGNALRTMRLYITRIKALQDTNDRAGTGGGDDIAMGGLFVGAKGHTTRVSQFEPSDDSFDSGDAVHLGKSRVFAKWDLVTEPKGFPYVYIAVIGLAETDDGGFDEFLEKLWGQVKSTVESTVSEHIGEDLGKVIGNLVYGTIGGMIGGIIGEFVDWIVRIFDSPDDIIGVKTLRITLAKSTMSYYVSRHLTASGGSARTLDYRGQGGHYLVDVAFVVS